MKKTLSLNPLLLAAVVCAVCLMTACEEHDGVSYFKSKCVAGLNGQTYIDQTPFTLSPDCIVTPELNCSGDALSFFTMLRPQRNGTVDYVVSISLFASEPGALLSKEQTIKKIEIPSPAVEPYWSDYAMYCRDNKISYATVNYEVVSGGSFKITRVTSSGNGTMEYGGTFALRFSKGVLKGEFSTKAQ